MTVFRQPLVRPVLPSCHEYGSKWQSGLNFGISTFLETRDNRSYWGIFDPLFSDTCITGAESEITSFTGRKTGLIIPYRVADRLPDGLEQGKWKKRE
jgi:hypothetical protein